MIATLLEFLTLILYLLFTVFLTLIVGLFIAVVVLLIKEIIEERRK